LWPAPISCGTSTCSAWPLLLLLLLLLLLHLALVRALLLLELHVEVVLLQLCRNAAAWHQVSRQSSHLLPLRRILGTLRPNTHAYTPHAEPSSKR